jgi:arabinofuranosyltransferase
MLLSDSSAHAKHTWRLGLLVLVAAISIGAYVGFSAVTYRVGFPLDDAWIHQTYARNLALRGEWAFISGQPSAGSTSPLWSALLVPGYWLGLAPYLWTYLLGWAALLGVGLAGWRIFLVFHPGKPGLAIAAGLFLTLEWHLVWAAASGMETLLFALLVLIVLSCLVAGYKKWWVYGLLVGVSIWLRPDGITLAGPVLLLIFVTEKGWKGRLLEAIFFGLCVLVLALPYLGFNFSLSGAWWPNTYFAKQAEYAIYRQLPLWQRFLQQAGLLLIGPGALLLPGFFIVSVRALRLRNWAALAGVIWLIGYLIIYALRLPVTYQFGRYVMPVMPVYFLWSLAGIAYWVKPVEPKPWKRILGRSWVAALVFVLLGFWAIGANAYARSVAIIETEMVDSARWIAQNTPSGALIAAHDIGALGYFGQRRLLDLAGLVSPEVIPFIRDQSRLAAFLDQRNADYLMTFPDWYPDLVKRLTEVYISRGIFSPQQGGENMRVYRWGH